MTDTGPGQLPAAYPYPYAALPVASPPQAPVIPPPPAGPGAVPPFPAPPTEGRGIRLWWGLGAGGLAVLLFCGGGATAVYALGTVTTRAVNEQAQVVVGHYFDAMRDKRYADAYDQQCAEERGNESKAAFTGRVATERAITSYRIGRVSLATTEPTVPVDLSYAGGDVDTVQVRLSQDPGTGAFEVCGVED